MPIAATSTTLYSFKTPTGRLLRKIRVDVTGLSGGANDIPHGITRTEKPTVSVPTIIEECLLPNSVTVAHRTAAGDATNLHYTVDSGSTTLSVYVVV